MPIDSQLEHNKTVVRRYIEECINDGNMALVDEFFVPERAGLVKQFHAGNGDGGPFPDGIEEIKDLVAEGNKVMARWIFRATHTGEIWGIAPTSKTIEVTGYAVYYFRDGKIEWDTMSMEWTDAIEQLGGRIMPPEASVTPA